MGNREGTEGGQERGRIESQAGSYGSKKVTEYMMPERPVFFEWKETAQ